jgi:hypothetical protein
MLEWICPQCKHVVPAGVPTCPQCQKTGTPGETNKKEVMGRAIADVQTASRGKTSFWPDFERGFRFGLGFVAVLITVYFLLFLVAYFGDKPEWVYRLADWIRLRW